MFERNLWREIQRLLELILVVGLINHALLFNARMMAVKIPIYVNLWSEFAETFFVSVFHIFLENI